MCDICCHDFFVYTYSTNDLKCVESLMKVIEFDMQHIYCAVVSIAYQTDHVNCYYCRTTIKTETRQCMQIIMDIISGCAGIENVCYVPHPHTCEKLSKYIMSPCLCIQWIHPNYSE